MWRVGGGGSHCRAETRSRNTRRWIFSGGRARHFAFGDEENPPSEVVVSTIGARNTMVSHERLGLCHFVKPTRLSADNRRPRLQNRLQWPENRAATNEHSSAALRVALGRQQCNRT
jgi:hypothetical protein